MRNNRLVLYADDQGWHVALVRNGEAYPFWKILDEPGYMWLLQEARKGERNFEDIKEIKQELDYKYQKRKEREKEDLEEYIRKEAFKPERQYFH